jgi:MFS transporter, DHA2 family, methylenomycin A resistance protein
MDGGNPQSVNAAQFDETSWLQDRRWLTLTTLCAAVLIAQLDSSVANLAIRPIGDDLQAGLGALQWVIDSYNLVYAVMLLTGGLLADLYGRRLVFMAGAGIFTAASLLCTLAPSVQWLIGGRALAGVGAALLLPSSLAIIRVVWPGAKQRGRALGIWAGCNGLALAIGPTVGGLLIQRFGWRSIFLVVVPIGIAAVALALAAVPESADPDNRRFDAPAQILGILALGGLALAAIESHSSLLAAAISLVVAIAALVLFVRVERRAEEGALVPLDLFGLRIFQGAIAATAGMTFGMYGAMFLLPLAWQSSGVLGPTGAGLALIPMAVAFILVSPFSGLLSGKLGHRTVASGGVAVIGCGLLIIGGTAWTGSLWAAEVGLMLTGLGMGLATGPLMDMAVGAVTAARSGTAAALINVARMTGATMGVAALGALFAFAHGGAGGVGLALLLGGAVQIASAIFLWTAE